MKHVTIERFRIDDLEKYIKAKDTIFSFNSSVDLLVDSNTGEILISNHDANKLTGKLPLVFGKINGNFNCSHLKLTTLEGCPTEVNGDFYCSHNLLKNLKDSPKIVRDNYFCNNNLLTSLEGCVKRIDANFYCGDNKLIDLSNGPTYVCHLYACSHFGEASILRGDKIECMMFRCIHTDLRSLVGIHRVIKSANSIDISGNDIKEGGLGLLLIDGLATVKHDNESSRFDLSLQIIKKYFGKGKRGMIDCQTELIKAGYKEFAKL